jgi:hypothetical protein
MKRYFITKDEDGQPVECELLYIGQESYPVYSRNDNTVGVGHTIVFVGMTPDGRVVKPEASQCKIISTTR